MSVEQAPECASERCRVDVQTCGGELRVADQPGEHYLGEFAVSLDPLAQRL
jgi:hypothetical protein